MTFAAERELEHLGETSGCADHDHDLVHELSRRLDMIWRYDQYIANAESRDEIQKLWRDLKAQEEASVTRIKQVLKGEIQDGCF